jgi:hypothetical protein
VDDLPLQVGQADHVIVDQPDRADARRRQIKGRRRAEPAGAEDEHARALKTLLAAPPTSASTIWRA